MSKDFRIELSKKEKIDAFRRMPLQVGAYVLSIQCSKVHNCTPPINTSVYNYKTMEVAMYKDGKNVSVLTDEFFNDWEDREDFADCYTLLLDIADNVPVELIQSLIDYIYKKSLKW
jgi:hypothetical protein